MRTRNSGNYRAPPARPALPPSSGSLRRSVSPALQVLITLPEQARLRVHPFSKNTCSRVYSLRVARRLCQAHRRYRLNQSLPWPPSVNTEARRTLSYLCTKQTLSAVHLAGASCCQGHALSLRAQDSKHTLLDESRAKHGYINNEEVSSITAPAEFMAHIVALNCLASVATLRSISLAFELSALLGKVQGRYTYILCRVRSDVSRGPVLVVTGLLVWGYWVWFSGLETARLAYTREHADASYWRGGRPSMARSVIAGRSRPYALSAMNCVVSAKHLPPCMCIAQNERALCSPRCQWPRCLSPLAA
eukprot:3760905-Pleurochrysis_carterae.AAC.2